MALLELHGVRKTYPGVRALAGVDFDVDAGEVHALLGENGAGKSTLMKATAGSVVPDEGQMRVDGEPVPFGSPEASRRAGIAIVYQELSLVPSLSIAENVLLGRWPTARFGLVDWRGLEDRAREALQRVGLDDLDVRGRVEGLSMADRQLVEVAKALSTDARVLLLDEPTSALSGPEAERLFAIIDDLSGQGVGIVYVSHRLGEVLRIADRVTVLRDGGHVGTHPIKDVTEADLAVMMVGREVDTDTRERATDERGEAGELLLRARDLRRLPGLRGVDLDLHAGEVVAVFGLVGSGRSQLARTLFGLDPARGGTVEVGGEQVEIDGPDVAAALGIGYLAQDRAESIVPSMGALQNITLASLRRISRGPLLQFDRERDLGERFIDELDIKVRSPDQRGETLSGGNQQKVILARWLASQSRVLVLDDPTRGIDVGAKEEVFRLVKRLAADGVAVLYLTSEIKEAKALSDRILVMAGGRVVSELEPDAPQERVMEAAGGAHG
jgi:ABC-type sugar transport system ATPase subunit